MTKIVRLCGLAALLLLVFRLGAVVHGESGQSGAPPSGSIVALGYFPDRQKAALRSGVGVADLSVVATITSTITGQIEIRGKPNLQIDAVFSNASQTCVVSILWVTRAGDSPTGAITNTLWSGQRTLAGNSKPGPGDVGYATAPGALWDSRGAYFAYVVVDTTAASGTESLYAATY